MNGCSSVPGLRQNVEPGTLTSVSNGGDEVRVQELQVLFQIKIDVPSAAGSSVPRTSLNQVQIMDTIHPSVENQEAVLFLTLNVTTIDDTET